MEIVTRAHSELKHKFLQRFYMEVVVNNRNTWLPEFSVISCRHMECVRHNTLYHGIFKHPSTSTAVMAPLHLLPYLPFPHPLPLLPPPPPHPPTKSSHPHPHSPHPPPSYPRHHHQHPSSSPPTPPPT